MMRGSKRVHGDVEGDRISAREEVFVLVRNVPPGRVVTYGQISTELGSRLSPRAIGWIMHRCPDDVPWHRVVNASGGCSTDRLPDFPKGLQRAMLEEEGVEFSDNETLDLEVYRWIPESSQGGSRGHGPKVSPRGDTGRR
jgi:methylated-DNA-protein-cysteine methyltransferase-like protein